MLCFCKQSLAVFCDSVLDVIILSEVSQKEKDMYHNITYIWNIKIVQMNFYKTEIDLQTWKKNLWLPKGKEGEA